MSAPTVEELFVDLDADDPRCELVFECEEHGAEPCDGRARWVMVIHCPNGGSSAQLLVCDECHDEITRAGSQMMGDHTVTWRAL